MSGELCPDGELLAAVGAALYGPHWREPLAAALDIRDRAFQRWLPGKAEIPPGIWAELLALCDKREVEIGAARGRVEQHIRSL